VLLGDRVTSLIYIQGGNLSGSLALPASFDDIIVISWENSKCMAIMPPELAGRASGPLRLPPCTPP